MAAVAVGFGCRRGPSEPAAGAAVPSQQRLPREAWASAVLGADAEDATAVRQRRRGLRSAAAAGVVRYRGSAGAPPLHVVERGEAEGHRVGSASLLGSASRSSLSLCYGTVVDG